MDAGAPGHLGHSDMLMPRAPALLAGYGQGGFPISTTVAKAQQFFDNGMQLAHAFANRASIAAFQEAERLDPGCAMCVWGEAWASGPTINDTKSPEQIAASAFLADRAAKLCAVRGSRREADLIAALQTRYKDGGGGKSGDLAFAKAMERLVALYPLDNEIGTMAADAWLIAPRSNAHGSIPNSWRAMGMLEAVLKRDPNYSPAIHFYIHATEAADQPARAEAYADRLTALAPSSSHLVHMPSHTWYWVGRYQDAADANMRAVALGVANAKRLGISQPDGIWGLPYHEHNVTFGIGAALMAGDAKTALALGRPLIARAEVANEADAAQQLISAEGYFAISRFAEPQEMLSLPEPHLPFLKGYWHYGRGEALARKGDIQGVLAEAGAIPGRIETSAQNSDTRAATDILAVARFVLLGRAAMLFHDPRKAIENFLKATQLEEGEEISSSYDPPAWWYPVRRDLAAARLSAGDAEGALKDASTALSLRPRDPVALDIRARASARLGKH
ncbi:MAG: hypothetical protein NVS3B5_22590 [Sphingomicrobium sp.]